MQNVRSIRGHDWLRVSDSELDKVGMRTHDALTKDNQVARHNICTLSYRTDWLSIKHIGE